MRYSWGSGYDQRAAVSALKARTMDAMARSASDGAVTSTVGALRPSSIRTINPACRPLLRRLGIHPEDLPVVAIEVVEAAAEVSTTSQT